GGRGNSTATGRTIPPGSKPPSCTSCASCDRPMTSRPPERLVVLLHRVGARDADILEDPVVDRFQPPPLPRPVDPAPDVPPRAPSAPPGAVRRRRALRARGRGRGPCCARAAPPPPPLRSRKSIHAILHRPTRGRLAAPS